MNDRGSVSVLTAGLCVLVVAVGVGGIRVAESEVLRHGAQAAADATVLAAARVPDQADAVARANGARVVDVATGSGWIEVEVERRGARARARAGRPPSAGGAGLHPALGAALTRAELLVGHPIAVVSGFRSSDEQAALWARRGTNPYPVAPPGLSAHERGLAVDLSPADAAVVESLHVGLCRPYANDPVHLELC